MSEIQLVAERIAGEWATAHGTLTGPRETSLVEHVLTELDEPCLRKLHRRWVPLLTDATGGPS
ncbi:MAG: hypothetical protein H0U62_12535 [Actinobacteria bacterium]|nr:hypothetical protein [Actinomycetota bacterium]